MKKKLVIVMMLLSITVCNLINYTQNVTYMVDNDGEIELHGDNEYRTI